MIPNRFPAPEDQELEPQKKPSAFQLSDVNWRGIGYLILLILVFLIGLIIIQEFSEVGGGFGSAVMDWLKDISIIPDNEQGFRNFLRLVGVAGFIYLILRITKPKT